MEKLTLAEKMKKWDKGQSVYSLSEYILSRIPKGERINQDFLDSFAECSICPIGNASCLEYFEITIKGICPDGSIELKTIRICSLGCDSESCVLNT
jgi:hypothetical protein